MTEIFALILSGAVSFAVSLWLIEKSRRFALLDIPNIRSSHNKVMPKGGGIGIVLGVLVAAGAYFLMNPFAIEARYIGIIAGSLSMAILGFLSDRFGISAFIRIILQVLIASAAVCFISIPPSFEIGSHYFYMGIGGLLLAVLWLVSITNFYNFMDGIDGLAATQAAVSGIGIALLGLISGHKVLIPLGLILSGSTFGFLFLNFPPAKIFMGDTGSYTLGFYIASFALIDKRLLVPVALILGVFIFDTVVTLIRRIIKREKWLKAHKSHFYQRLTLLGYSHRTVTIALSAINIVLTIMACLYLAAYGFFKLGIIILAVIILSSTALFTRFKEHVGRG